MSQEISGHTPDPIAALATLQAAHTAQIQALTAQRDDLLAALEELLLMLDGGAPLSTASAYAAIAKARGQ
jgi:hypothetical protein